jgi:hypothetical protein
VKACGAKREVEERRVFWPGARSRRDFVRELACRSRCGGGAASGLVTLVCSRQPISSKEAVRYDKKRLLNVRCCPEPEMKTA